MTQQPIQHKLAVIDKDGALVTPKSREVFIKAPEDQILVPQVIDRLKYLQERGYRLAIASNQGGVASGYKTLKNALLEMRYCLELLKEHNILIDRALLCPDYEGAICYSVDIQNKQYQRIDATTKSTAIECLYDIKSLSKQYRKPQNGMLKLACKHPDEYRVMIGVRAEDETASHMANFDSYVNAQAWHNGEIVLP